VDKNLARLLIFSLALAPWLRAQERPVAFVDVTVVPMDKEQILPHRTVVIEGGRIGQIGPASLVKVARGTTRIEGKGKFLMPGLTDMHVHFVREALPQNAPLLAQGYSGRTPGIPASASSDHERENTAYALMFLANGINRCFCERNRIGSCSGTACLFNRTNH
jgi:hypothetical protein